MIKQVRLYAIIVLLVLLMSILITGMIVANTRHKASREFICYDTRQGKMCLYENIP